MTRAWVAWAMVAALLAAGAALGWWLPHDSIDWQPALAWREPWRAFTAAGVHYSVPHLAGNLAGLALTALFGSVARVPPRLAGAWLAAWPLTQLGLLVKPELAHYGGLSGVLHAGVAVVITGLLIGGSRAQRRVAAVLLLGLGAKLLSETPWGEALRQPFGWDIALAPIAHTTGALAGALCAIAALRLPQRRNEASDDPV